jgi:hypothetical protein
VISFGVNRAVFGEAGKGEPHDQGTEMFRSFEFVSDFVFRSSDFLAEVPFDHPSTN